MAANDDFARAEYHLIGWGEWRRRDRWSAGVGYGSRSAGFTTGGSGYDDIDDLVAVEDAKAAHICDTVIWGMEIRLRIRLESEYIMQGVIKSGRGDDAELLAEAKAVFWEQAKRNLV